MFGPTRGGTRGGQAEFSWDQVRGDQHRENYLGHSVQAPTGRWQNGRDVNWYNKEDGSGTKEDEDARKAARRAELVEIKAREEEEMNKRLGIKSGVLSSSGSGPGKALLTGSAPVNVAGTGSNTAPLANSRWGSSSSAKPASGAADEDGLTKEDKKLARKLAKESVRQAKHDEKVRIRAERAERRAKRDAEGGGGASTRGGSRSRHSEDEYEERRRGDSSSRYRDEDRAKATLALETLQRRFINRTLLVHTTDGRAFEGTLICTDDTCNVILGSADELRPSSPSSTTRQAPALGAPPARRWVGMVMLPGKHIVRVEMSKTDVEHGNAPKVPQRPPLSMAGWPVLDEDAYM